MTTPTGKRKSRKLGKRQEKLLHDELCFDDLLNRKFQHLNDQLTKRIIQFNARKSVKKVLINKGDHTEVMMIEDVLDTGDGLMIIVKGRK